MERKHKKYLIISGIAYLFLYFTYNIATITKIPLPAYKAFNYLLLLVLVIAFIFGIRNSVRGIVIWLGIICGDLLLHLRSTISSIFSLELGNIIYVFDFALIIVAIVYGFKSLNLNTIASDNFSKMYRKPAIIFLVCIILCSILEIVTVIEFYWVTINNTSARIAYTISTILSFIISSSVMIIAISKIAKRKTFGFVLTAILIILLFSSYVSSILVGGVLTFASDAIQNDAIRSSLILSFPPKFLLTFGPHIYLLRLLFSLILLINFLFHLKRDPELITIKNNDVKPLPGATK